MRNLGRLTWEFTPQAQTAPPLLYTPPRIAYHSHNLTTKLPSGIAMKLTDYPYTLEEELDEFELWITASSEDLRKTAEFLNVLRSLEYGFDELALCTRDFATVKTCTAESLARSITARLVQTQADQAYFDALFSALLLATGKTDNNLKCQYPLALRSLYQDGLIPQLSKAGTVGTVAIPRVLELSKVVQKLLNLLPHSALFSPFLYSYLQSILSDTDYEQQLYALGRAYCRSKAENQSRAFLVPLALFQSRGSLTAKIGHVPEDLLRERLTEWGLRRDIDFNAQDVSVYDLTGRQPPAGEKLRKYDFILPYLPQELPGQPRLFVQCQFYAGDLGSVSHKVVDQTDEARRRTKELYPQAVFVEYLDGAGYFSSLNGDLKKMLMKPLTHSFFQIRTAPLKLRRELQLISFITPLEIEQIVLEGHKTKDTLYAALSQQGYAEAEIRRCLEVSLDCGLLIDHGQCFEINPDRFELIVSYCLLDCLALYGHVVDPQQEKGVLYVPGFAKNWGMNQPDLLAVFSREFTRVEVSSAILLNCIQWLINHGFVILK